MGQKEAKARIKINKLLEEAGWRFFDSEDGPANIQLELHTKITQKEFDAFGEDFESTKHGYLDFLLLDERGYPMIVLEAKSEDKNPLSAKEQARKYAKSQNCRFVILSNGNLHYFWDLERGNPYVITQFPKPWSVRGYQTTSPNPEKLIAEAITADYIVQTQYPTYKEAVAWKSEQERPAFIEKNALRFLREYQIRAIQSLQRSVKEGNDRFLFEMATGTGKTMIAAAVSKLFLKTGNAKRVLFLVDRLELEDQANKRFKQFLKNDFKTDIYKENRESWRNADIVATTVQSLLFNNKYKKLFSPTDFDLIISDEAHRSIGGNARAVFEYFIGYKLGLTATPKDYLKKFEHSNARDPRELERRILLDTYRTFGCEGGQPTFRYSLLDGVNDKFLINPKVVDARTDVTTQLLADEGYSVPVETEEGGQEETFFQRSFEKKFFSDPTNYTFCKTFLENALRDPLSNEIGKTIIFAVSQHHAAKLTQYLNELADQIFPGKYQSDFAMQVTSQVQDAQQFSINFSNNNLGGSANFNSTYKTSKTRVCVTVGMMTTGYDCEDILNLCLMRPIFSPTDFIQIKGRGTRTYEFTRDLFDTELKSQIGSAKKIHYKLFDFFANCEYFEEKFNYDEILKMPARAKTGTGSGSGIDTGPTVVIEGYERFDPDLLKTIQEHQIGLEGMKIDRRFFEKFEERIKEDEFIKTNVQEGNWGRIVEYVSTHILDKPEEFFTLDKLRKAAGIDRRLSLREIVEKAYGFIQQFKRRDDLLEEEFEKFIADTKPEKPDIIVPLKYFFKAYITDNRVRDIIENKRLTELNTNPTFTMRDFKAVPVAWRTRVPEYIKDYVSLNQFM